MDKERDWQLRVRCWEMGAALEAVGMIDRGEKVTNLAEGEKDTAGMLSTLAEFKHKLDVHSPGRVAWMGHSFGAATVAQFVKSVAYYSQDASDSTFLASPPSGALKAQITPASPTVFLDLWAQPLRSVYARALFAKPLPCYTGSSTTVAERAEKPAAPLVILSESFFRWSGNLADIIRVISPPAPINTTTTTTTTTSNIISGDGRDGDGELRTGAGGGELGLRPYIFYPPRSAHLSQSDFGPLFPWFTRRAFKAENPQRTILLNIRAILEMLRRVGIRVADTSAKDMELSSDEGKGDQVGGEVFSDSKILDTKEGTVIGWVAIPSDSAGETIDGAEVEIRTEAAAASSIEQVKEATMEKDEGYDSPGNIATPAEAVVEGR